MPRLGRYRVVITGFSVRSQTWDNAGNFDGKGDEVFLDTIVAVTRDDGTLAEESNPGSKTIGDTNGHPERVQGGTARLFWERTSTGGFQSGDSYPDATPWRRTRDPDPDKNWPPYIVWEGDVTENEPTRVLIPTIWEWDEGEPVEDTVKWLARINEAYGGRAKGAVEALFPPAKLQIGAIFDAVSIGIETINTLFERGPLGSAKSRAIGLKVNPADPTQPGVHPQIVPLTYEFLDRTATTDVGMGDGIFAIRYTDDPVYRGDYTIYLQVEKLHGRDDAPDPAPVFGDRTLWKKLHDPRVYIIAGGAKFPVPNPTVLTCLNPQGFAAVKVAADAALDAVPDVPVAGTILRELSTDPVWIMEAGVRRWIRTFSALDRLTHNARWDQVAVVPDGGLNNIPKGDDIWE